VSRAELTELRRALRQVLRRLWRRRAPSELLTLVSGEPQLGRRHVAALAHVGAEEPQTVSEIAHAVGVSLPAASKLTTELETHGLVHRSEDPDDRRRTVVALAPETAEHVRAWLTRRDHPLERALGTLTPEERAAFLKGLRALADALGEEPASSCREHRGPGRHGRRRAR
jgi:DNA-binding MarR family transcriptional regulator